MMRNYLIGDESAFSYQREGVILTDDLGGIEKPLGLADSLLQSCCVQVDNLIFQQKINTPGDHS